MSGDGNGWVACGCGSRHWGLYGAAGLFLTHEDTALLQLRPDWAHQGGTWAIPGGARDSHENILQAALREAHEETALATADIDILGIHSVVHPDWRYDTVLASVAGRPQVSEHEESVELRWVPLPEIADLDLHPGFRQALPHLLVPRVLLAVDAGVLVTGGLERLVGQVRSLAGRDVLIDGVEVFEGTSGGLYQNARTLTNVIICADAPVPGRVCLDADQLREWLNR